MEKTALLSDCGRYRYNLTRRWGAEDWCLFIMLNPSTADASQDDPTIRRCMGFARKWGYGGLIVCNLFPLRATDPQELYSATYPASVGERNIAKVLSACAQANLIVCAWGNHGALRNAGAFCRKGLGEVHHHRLFNLGVTGIYQPKHPLYLKADTMPILWGDA